MINQVLLLQLDATTDSSVVHHELFASFPFSSMFFISLFLSQCVRVYMFVFELLAAGDSSICARFSLPLLSSLFHMYFLYLLSRLTLVLMDSISGVRVGAFLPLK